MKTITNIIINHEKIECLLSRIKNKTKVSSQTLYNIILEVLDKARGRHKIVLHPPDSNVYTENLMEPIKKLPDLISLSMSLDTRYIHKNQFYVPTSKTQKLTLKDNNIKIMEYLGINLTKYIS